MQTRTPLPVDPPQAHSRVISAGQTLSTAISPAAPAGRLQAGRPDSLMTAMLLLRQPLAKVGEECGAGLDPFGGDRRLEIGEDALPQLRVRFRARNELVQSGAG